MVRRRRNLLKAFHGTRFLGSRVSCSYSSFQNNIHNFALTFCSSFFHSSITFSATLNPSIASRRFSHIIGVSTSHIALTSGQADISANLKQSLSDLDFRQPVVQRSADMDTKLGAAIQRAQHAKVE